MVSHRGSGPRIWVQLRWVLWPVGSRSAQLGQDPLPDKISVVGRTRPLVLAGLRASGLHCFWREATLVHCSMGFSGGQLPGQQASLEGTRERVSKVEGTVLVMRPQNWPSISQSRFAN